MKTEDLRQALAAAGFGAVEPSTPLGYGEPIDHAIDRHCAGYDSIDFLRLAWAALAEAGLHVAWILAPLLCAEEARSAKAITASAESHNNCFSYGYAEHIDRALDAVAPSDRDEPAAQIILVRLALAALDQAGVSAAGQRTAAERLERFVIEPRPASPPATDRPCYYCGAQSNAALHDPPGWCRDVCTPCYTAAMGRPPVRPVRRES